MPYSTLENLPVRSSALASLARTTELATGSPQVVATNSLAFGGMGPITLVELGWEVIIFGPAQPVKSPRQHPMLAIITLIFMLFPFILMLSR